MFVWIQGVAADPPRPPPVAGASGRRTEILRELLALAPPGHDGSAWMLSSWDTDSGLEALISPPTGAGNAAAAFSRLEELYPSEKDAIAGGGEDSLGVGALIEAAGMAECRLTPEYYPVFDHLAARQPDFAVLRGYLEALRRRAARAEREGRQSEAEEALRAALLCGRHLTRDRPSLLVYIAGLIYKLRGIQDYQAFLLRAGRTEAAGTAEAYSQSLGLILRFFHWKANVALGEMEGFACLPAAVLIAGNDAEACWRKEALLKLGILRHGAVGGDGKSLVRDIARQREAEAALSLAAAADPDPGVRRLAIWAALNVRPEMLADLEQVF
ncbi:MAG: hypothetical protein LBU64_08135 [Planctomycetota bacterium]|nr:hypothetical protein [Planctomycetota bacterium]